MAKTSAKPLTLSEFLTLPETEPSSEYINGQMIQKPMPQGEHSVIQGELIIAINAAIKPQKIARAFPELRCTLADRRSFQISLSLPGKEFLAKKMVALLICFP